MNLRKINYGTDIGHTAFTVDQEQQVTITTVKRNLNNKSQVSNGDSRMREFNYVH